MIKFQPIWKETQHEINKCKQCTPKQTQNKPSILRRFFKKIAKENK